MPQKKVSNAPEKSSSFGLPDILLLLAILGVLFTTSFVKDRIQSTSGSIDGLAAPLSNEPIQIENNRKCPHAQQDYESCMQKYQRCKDTQVQFKKAEQQFKKLISDCASSNDQNEKINIEMQGQLKKLQDHLKTMEKK